MQLKTKPQLDALNKPAASTTTVQVKKKPQLDPLNKKTELRTMQAKKNPQLDPLNKKTELRTMQAKKNPQLNPLNKPAASTTTVQVKKKPQLDPLNKQTASTTTVQVKKNLHLNALNKPAASTTTMQVKKNLQLNALNKQTASSVKKIIPEKQTKSGGVSLLKILFICLPLVSILSHIILPPFLDCSQKARQSEGKQYVSSINKGQQAYFVENTRFGTSIDALGLGIKTQTINYKYSISATKDAAFSYAVSSHETKSLTSYVGAVFLLPVSQAANDTKTTVSILCGTTSFGKTQPPNPIIENDVPVCAAGTEPLTR